VSRLDKLREGGDIDEVLEEVITARRVGTDPKELFGGPRDWVDALLPTFAFVVANVAGGLDTAIKAAVVAEVLVIAVRLVRRETLRHAFSGAFGVALAIFLAKRSGDAKNFFLPGIVINLTYGGVFVLSAVLRKPIVGLIMRVIQDKPKEWHEHPVVRRAYTEATLLWAATFFVRGIVAEVLRREDQLGWLTVMKVAGTPIYVAALALTLPYVKRRTRSVPEPEPEPAGEDAADDAA
jgi:intracellular septation protein A